MIGAATERGRGHREGWGGARDEHEEAQTARELWRGGARLREMEQQSVRLTSADPVIRPLLWLHLRAEEAPRPGLEPSYPRA